MIERYYRFDVDGFFRDYRKNKNRLQELKTELDSAADISAVSYSDELHENAMPSDPTVNKVKKRMTIEEKQRELYEYFHMYERIISKLNATEKLIVEKYLMRECSKESAADFCMNALGIERTTFYSQLSALRRNISDIADWL